MGVYVEQVPNEPIVLVYFLNPFDVKTDIPALSEKMRVIYEAADQPIWDITIALDLQISFGDMVSGLAMMTKGEFSTVHHPNAAGFAVVANQALIKLGAQSLTQVQYGNLKMHVADTLEQALIKVRNEIAQQRARAAA